MADITITIPNAQLSRFVDAICYNNRYEENVPDVDGNVSPNPETRAQFARRMIIQYCVSHVESFEASRDAEQARMDAVTRVRSEVRIT